MKFSVVLSEFENPKVVSETLARLDQLKLQQFAQYLLNELPKSHLALAQDILDKLTQNKQEDLIIPDPTAGASIDAKHEWLLDSNLLTERIRKTLTKFCSPSPIVSEPMNFTNYDSVLQTEYNALFRPQWNQEPAGIWDLINIIESMNLNGDQTAYKLLQMITDICLEFTQIPKWWYQTFVSTAYTQPSGNQQRSRSEESNQQFAYYLMKYIVSLWTKMVTKNYRLVTLEIVERWHAKTLASIRTGRFRENQLELLPGFKPVIETIKKKMTGQMLDQHLDIMTQVAFGRPNRDLIVKSINEILSSPAEIFIPKEPAREKDSKNSKKASLRAATSASVEFLEKALFFTRYAAENDNNDRELISLGVRLGLHALALRRPPASTKALEVRLFFHQAKIGELVKTMFHSNIKSVYLDSMRKYASLIIAAEQEGWITGQHESDGHILPIILARLIFETFDDDTLTECDRELGFWSANAALGFKLTVAESEYPLLVEAVRRQRGELAFRLLVRFKDDRSALGTILEKLLDRTILNGIKSTSIFGERRNISPIPPPPPLEPRYVRSQSSADESGYIHTGRRRSFVRSAPPTHRKSRVHASYVSSSASEEAMLSDDNHHQHHQDHRLVHRPTTPSTESDSSSTDSQDQPNWQHFNRDQPLPNVAPHPPPHPPQPIIPPAVQQPAQRRVRRPGKGSAVIPDIPNAPSDSLANFFFDLAKKLLEQAGMRSDYNFHAQPNDAFFMNDQVSNHQRANPNSPPYSRNLHLASFEVQLYALAVHNSITSTWLSRNYSRHGRSVTVQAMELGAQAIDVLVRSWEGHLTCAETINLALMASKQSDLRNEMQKSAAELALSCLQHCALLQPNDIRNALIQCRDYQLSTFELALVTVETNGIDRDGLIPEALFEVSKQWEWLHEKRTPKNLHRKDNLQTYEALATPSFPPVQHRTPPPPHPNAQSSPYNMNAHFSNLALGGAPYQLPYMVPPPPVVQPQNNRANLITEPSKSL